MPLNIDELLKDTEDRMDKAVKVAHSELAHLRTGKASIVLLDPVRVEAYGTIMPLKQVASVIIQAPRTIVVQPWDKSILGEIEKGILKANIGLTPSNDGNVIRINVPTLTGERREELVKVAGQIIEKGKVAVRSIRRDAISTLKEAEKDGDISEDISFKSQKDIQKSTDDIQEELDKIFEDKKKEIMTV